MRPRGIKPPKGAKVQVNSADLGRCQHPGCTMMTAFGSCSLHRRADQITPKKVQRNSR